MCSKIKRWRHYVVALIFCIVSVCPLVLLRVSDWFYQLIGNMHPSRFLGLVFFAVILVSCALIAIAKKDKRRKYAFRIFSVLLWGIFALSVADFILCQFSDPYIGPKGWTVGDPKLRFRYKPYVQFKGWVLGDQTHWDVRERRYVEYITDKNGFRNQIDLKSAKVVCIGDSFTVSGSKGNKTFPAILSQLTGYSVANLGRGGYTAQQELEVLRQYGLPLRPAVLVWQIFEGNDLNESISYENWRHGKTPPALRQARRRVIISVKNLLNRSVILNTLRRFLMPSKMQLGYKPAGNVDTVIEHRGWVSLKSTLMEGVQLAKANQIRTIFIFFPCKASLYKSSAPRPGMATLLRQFAQDHEIDFIDMWEIYRTRYRQSGEIYYWFNDSHISDDGCRLAAKVIAKVGLVRQ